MEIFGNKKKKLEAIVTAIGALDVNDKSMWTADGKPQAPALAKALNTDVSAADRDHAWDVYQKNLQSGQDANASEAAGEESASAEETPEGNQEQDGASAANAVPAAAGEYEVISPLQLDGKLYAIGDSVTLTAEQAEQLLKHTVKPFN